MLKHQKNIHQKIRNLSEIEADKFIFPLNITDGQTNGQMT